MPETKSKAEIPITQRLARDRSCDESRQKDLVAAAGLELTTYGLWATYTEVKHNKINRLARKNSVIRS